MIEMCSFASCGFEELRVSKVARMAIIGYCEASPEESWFSLPKGMSLSGGSYGGHLSHIQYLQQKVDTSPKCARKCIEAFPGFSHPVTKNVVSTVCSSSTSDKNTFSTCIMQSCHGYFSADRANAFLTEFCASPEPIFAAGLIQAAADDGPIMDAPPSLPSEPSEPSDPNPTNVPPPSDPQPSPPVPTVEPSSPGTEPPQEPYAPLKPHQLLSHRNLQLPPRLPIPQPPPETSAEPSPQPPPPSTSSPLPSPTESPSPSTTQSEILSTSSASASPTSSSTITTTSFLATTTAPLFTTTSSRATAGVPPAAGNGGGSGTGPGLKTISEVSPNGSVRKVGDVERMTFLTVGVVAFALFL
ncbi:hypothetical protein BC829DRAFT_138075 [Chytridium lagenaria]|nr:hypothetical protein BC829DRAFT_138075 [Chytridium lagenaria]